MLPAAYSVSLAQLPTSPQGFVRGQGDFLVLDASGSPVRKRELVDFWHQLQAEKVETLCSSEDREPLTGEAIHQFFRVEENSAWLKLVTRAPLVWYRLWLHWAIAQGLTVVVGRAWRAQAAAAVSRRERSQMTLGALLQSVLVGPPPLFLFFVHQFYWQELEELETFSSYQDFLQLVTQGTYSAQKLSLLQQYEQLHSQPRRMFFSSLETSSERSLPGISFVRTAQFLGEKEKAQDFLRRQGLPQ